MPIVVPKMETERTKQPHWEGDVSGMTTPSASDISKKLQAP